MNPTNYELPHEDLGKQGQKFCMMTIPTLRQSRILTNNTNNNKWNIKTLKNKPAEDFTKPNITQLNKEKMVPLIDMNGCGVTVSKVVHKKKVQRQIQAWNGNIVKSI